MLSADILDSLSQAEKERRAYRVAVRAKLAGRTYDDAVAVVIALGLARDVPEADAMIAAGEGAER